MSYQKPGARRTPEQEAARQRRSSKQCKVCGKRESEHPGGAFCQREPKQPKQPTMAFFDLENGYVVMIEDGVEKQVPPGSTMYSTAVMLAGGDCKRKVDEEWIDA